MNQLIAPNIRLHAMQQDLQKSYEEKIRLMIQLRDSRQQCNRWKTHFENMTSKAQHLEKALRDTEKKLKEEQERTRGLQSKVRKVKRRLRNELPKS